MGFNEARVFIGLIHSPIYNKNNEEITTTVTNYDLHDISRAGKTYDIEKYFVINHLKSQQSLVKRMKDYWVNGDGAEYNENRKQAFEILEIADTLPQVVKNIEEKTGKKPVLIATDAREFPSTISYKKMRHHIKKAKYPFLILFGTGWGLTEKTMDKCDYILKPIWGRGDFNHLSVRSAVSIILDRLLSNDWWK